ncbi:hypothetical protein JL193_09535 [Polaribacter batillariae]|uniref:DUF4249 family protein n=1 Tax=Polaribacter batillariae TaxID=2808900 RepID=A0ABX7SQK1_9FLAO|nr:hypothetical protein [Polaribacter batillariae]QTD36401.1 hypothetical protein JL193_09535 [Polaribacter batillariae]
MNNIVIKYKILILCLIFFSCSSNEDPITEPKEELFTVELVATNTSINIDEVVTFKIK